MMMMIMAILIKLERCTLWNTMIFQRLFTPDYVGRCRVNETREHRRPLGHSCTNVNQGRCCATVCSNYGNRRSYFRVAVGLRMGSVVPMLKITRQADMDGHTFTLERKNAIIRKNGRLKTPNQKVW